MQDLFLMHTFQMPLLVQFLLFFLESLVWNFLADLSGDSSSSDASSSITSSSSQSSSDSCCQFSSDHDFFLAFSDVFLFYCSPISLLRYCLFAFYPCLPPLFHLSFSLCIPIFVDSVELCCISNSSSYLVDAKNKLYFFFCRTVCVCCISCLHYPNSGN